MSKRVRVEKYGIFVIRLDFASGECFEIVFKINAIKVRIIAKYTKSANTWLHGDATHPKQTHVKHVRKRYHHL